MEQLCNCFIFPLNTCRSRKPRCTVLHGTVIPQLPEHSARPAAMSTQRTERARARCWPRLLGVLLISSSAWWSIGPIWKLVTRWLFISIVSTGIISLCWCNLSGSIDPLLAANGPGEITDTLPVSRMDTQPSTWPCGGVKLKWSVASLDTTVTLTNRIATVTRHYTLLARMETFPSSWLFAVLSPTLTSLTRWVLPSR